MRNIHNITSCYYNAITIFYCHSISCSLVLCFFSQSFFAQSLKATFISNQKHFLRIHHARNKMIVCPSSPTELRRVHYVRVNYTANSLRSPTQKFGQLPKPKVADDKQIEVALRLRLTGSDRAKNESSPYFRFV